VTNWWTQCKSDPRFNMSGTAYGIAGARLAIDKAILSKAAELGIEPPDDIEIGATKE